MLAKTRSAYPKLLLSAAATIALSGTYFASSQVQIQVQRAASSGATSTPEPDFRYAALTTGDKLVYFTEGSELLVGAIRNISEKFKSQGRRPVECDATSRLCVADVFVKRYNEITDSYRENLKSGGVSKYLAASNLLERAEPSGVPREERERALIAADIKSGKIDLSSIKKQVIYPNGRWTLSGVPVVVGDLLATVHSNRLPLHGVDKPAESRDEVSVAFERYGSDGTKQFSAEVVGSSCGESNLSIWHPYLPRTKTYDSGRIDYVFSGYGLIDRQRAEVISLNKASAYKLTVDHEPSIMKADAPTAKFCRELVGFLVDLDNRLKSAKTTTGQ